MAQLTFFNPDTGEKLGGAKGTVRWDNPQADPVQQLIDMQERMMKRDEQPKAFTAEGQATVHISRRKWKRLKTSVHDAAATDSAKTEKGGTAHTHRNRQRELQRGRAIQ